MNKWIVFDVDDVICNFRESLYMSFKKLDKDIHWSGWKSYDCVSLFGLQDESALHQHMKDHQVLEKCVPEQGIEALLANIKALGFNVGLLTARAWHQDAQAITEQFIDKYKLPVDRVVISGFHMDRKSSHIPKFSGQVHAYIDDSVHHVEDFITQGVSQTYLMDRPWNQHSLLPRVKSLADIEHAIKRLHHA